MKAEKKEVNAIILDVLLKGHPDDPRPPFKREPIIQAMGIEQFKLLELIPKSVDIQIHDRVYIGDGEREKIERVKRRIGYNELTQTSRVELPFEVEQLVRERETEYVDKIFNKSVPITSKLHTLHLLPGIGKKLLWEILEERNRKPFENFSDISTRIKSIPHPEKMIISRILEELQDPEVKYRLFTSR